VELTARGQLALTCARRMADAALTLQRRLDGREPTELGTVRIACTPALGSALLAPKLAALTASHPGLNVELATDHRALSLARRDADVAVRFARPQAGDLVTRRVGRLDYAVHGLPDVIARWREDPGTCPFIGYDDGVPEIPETLRAARHIRREQLVMRSNDLPVQRAAALAGMGAVLLPVYLAGGGPVFAREIWLAYHRDLRHLPRVRAAADWLAACFTNATRFA
jgi:DNA-binding transcriptional LysR family regulator